MKEYALLRLLLQHRGKVVTHRQLLRDVWGPSHEEDTHYLRVHMANLRKKIEASANQPAFLKPNQASATASPIKVNGRQVF